MAELPMGSAGFVCTPRMSALIAQAGSGVLPSDEGGQELRDLYQVASAGWDPHLLDGFAFKCHIGDLEGVKKAVETGQAPPLTGTETPFKFGLGLYSATLKFLLENGCPPDVPDICRYTALGHATQTPRENADVAHILVEHGANVNHPDIYGMTPICGAIMTAFSKAVDVLMEGGADLGIPDADGTRMRDIYMAAGPKVTAIIHTWERRRAGKQVPLGEKRCAMCGKDGKLLWCAACHSILYCSSECQRSDWKEHKKSCKRFSASNTVTVKPRYLDGSVQIKPIQQVARAIAGFPSRPTSEAERCPSHEPTKYPKKKIIKVQFTASPAFVVPILVYDEKRDLFCHIERNDAPEAFDRLVEFVQSNGTFGRKAYLAAELKSKDELVIKIDEALADQPF